MNALRVFARWLLREEIATVREQLRVARVDALDAVLARDRIAVLFTRWASDHAGPKCGKVQLHSEVEAFAMIDRLREVDATDDEYNVYPCATCRHPAVRIWHIGHADARAAGSSRNRHSARADRRLTVRISDDRLSEIRARLVE